MRKIILTFGIITLYAIGYAQSLYINEQNGNQKSVVLSGVSILSFQNGNLIINEKGGSKQTFLLSGIRTLSFKNYTGVNTKKDNGQSIKIFPNPVNEVLNIQLPEENNNTIKIEVLDLSGRMLLSNIVVNKSVNTIFITVNSLNKGMYLCQIKEGEKTYTQKFIKN